MIEKVKVSREVANFFEKCKNSGDINWEDAVLHEHIKIFESHHTKEAVEINPDALCMLRYSPFELARILVLGYEIEETPEEVLLERYVQNDKNRKKAIQKKDTYQEGFTLGYLMGVKDGLNCAGKKIKGINE